MSVPPPPPPPPKSFPYDHLFKLLMIGDAGVGKVRCFFSLSSFEHFASSGLFLFWNSLIICTALHYTLHYITNTNIFSKTRFFFVFCFSFSMIHLMIPKQPTIPNAVYECCEQTTKKYEYDKQQQQPNKHFFSKKVIHVTPIHRRLLR